MRKLATIQKIAKIEPIENADVIEKATVKGWQCVVKKGDFKINDFCIYCEVDSVLPEKPEFEFLRKGCWNNRYKGFRIRTVKLRGQVSQGIAFPIGILCNSDYIKDSIVLKEGIDLTDILDIQKYVPEIPSCLSGKAKGALPSFIPKTDEERIQNIPNVLERHKGLEVYFTEKLDGTSGTYYFLKDGVFGVCGRNWEWEEDDRNTYWKIARQEYIEKKLRELNRNIAIQGEIIGPEIQKNRYNLDKIQLRLFNVFDIDEYRFLNLDEFVGFCGENYFNSVPILEIENIFLDGTVSDWVECSKGRSLLNPKIHREGIVVRPKTEMRDSELGRLSFKSLNPDFLLKYID